ncbi:MAG TPA: L,D-transpeptidase family protein [Pseudolabrys sp.]|nr:L,D-transpeptidase family protein [Pseudolabrys sp.]
MKRLAFIAFLFIAPVSANAQSCPQPLNDARRLVLVVADKMDSRVASVQRFTRASPAMPWQADGGPTSALIGLKGVGWARTFRALARNGEPIKVDGDKRAPAGFFRIGRPFGLSPSHLPRYLHLAQGTVCVDDPQSPAYNAITTRAAVGWTVHGENMWRVREYRRGLLVDYPTDAKARAGSCIFIHVRRPGGKGTAGCVALEEPEVAALQDFAQDGAVLAILPRAALPRFKGCLP